MSTAWCPQLTARRFVGDGGPLPGIRAIPGQATHVPLFILGSSLFGAELAAQLGLPYAFASHFAPRFLHEAIKAYLELVAVPCAR